MKNLTRLAIACLVLATPAFAEDPKPAAPAEKPADKPAAKAGDKAAEKAPDKSADKPAPATEGTASAEVKAGTGVEQHEIVGEAASFEQGTTVWVWSRINDGPASIKHVWKLDGKPMWTATLPVKSKKWTTQSRRTVTKGNWEVDVTDADGASLGKIEFAVTPGA